MRNTSLKSVAVAAALASLLAACSDAVTAPRATMTPTPVWRPTAALLANPSAGLPSTVTFANVFGTIQSPPLVGGPAYTLNVAAGACQTIWIKNVVTSTPADPSTIAVVTQTGQAAGYQFSGVQALGNSGTTDDAASKSATLYANAFHGATVTFTQALIPTTISGGSITLQGGTFSLLAGSDNVLSGTFRIANTSGSKQSVNIIDADVMPNAVAKIGGGKEMPVTISDCVITPVPVIIAPDQTQQFTVTGCDFNPAVAAGNEVNITVRAIVNGGSQPWYQRTYTVKAQ
jgi:hypothetical protein